MFITIHNPHETLTLPADDVRSATWRAGRAIISTCDSRHEIACSQAAFARAFGAPVPETVKTLKINADLSAASEGIEAALLDHLTPRMGTMDATCRAADLPKILTRIHAIPCTGGSIEVADDLSLPLIELFQALGLDQLATRVCAVSRPSRVDQDDITKVVEDRPGADDLGRSIWDALQKFAEGAAHRTQPPMTLPLIDPAIPFGEIVCAFYGR